MRLARYFGSEERFWINLQTNHQLEIGEAEFGDRILAEVTPSAA
jgi:antitoxin HigA-1